MTVSVILFIEYDTYHIFDTEIKIASIHPTVRLDVPGAILGAVCALHGRSTPQEHAAPSAPTYNNQPRTMLSIERLQAISQWVREERRQSYSPPLGPRSEL